MTDFAPDWKKQEPISKKPWVDEVYRLSILGMSYDVAWLAVSSFEQELDGEDDGVELRMADISFEQAMIRIAGANPQRVLLMTLLHEVIHAIMYQSGQIVDEETVRALAYGLLDVLRANPHFVKFLTGPIR